MIDLYEIEIPYALSDEELLRLPGHLSRKAPVNRQKVKLSDPMWTAGQNAMLMPGIVRLTVCPQKVLGQSNAYGTSDLQEAVRTTAPLALEKMGIDANAPEIRKILRTGSYKVREVHIAHQFHIENRSISDFVRGLFRRLIESHDVLRMSRGIGFSINPGSRTAEYCFYDKVNELDNAHAADLKKGIGSVYDRRMAALSRDDSFGRMGVNLDRGTQRIVASSGPRLEIRLRDHFFRDNGYGTGTEWRPDTADALYQKYLAKLKLPRRVSAVWARDRAERVLSATEFNTYLLWHHGEDLRRLKTSAKTVGRHHSVIQKKMKLDVSTPASATLGNRRTINAGRVFRWDNRVVPEAVEIDELWDLAEGPR